MAAIRAWPYGLRRIAACSTPGGSTSSTNEPIPRSSRGSSLRRTGVIGAGPLARSRASLSHLGGQTPGFDDVLVTPAATQVAPQRGPDLPARRVPLLPPHGHP